MSDAYIAGQIIGYIGRSLFHSYSGYVSNIVQDYIQDKFEEKAIDLASEFIDVMPKRFRSGSISRPMYPRFARTRSRFARASRRRSSYRRKGKFSRRGYRRLRYGRRRRYSRRKFGRKGKYVFGKSRFARRVARKERRKRISHIPIVKCNVSNDAYVGEVHTPMAQVVSNVTQLYGQPGGNDVCGIKTIARIRGLDSIYQMCEVFYPGLTDKTTLTIYKWISKIRLHNPNDNKIFGQVWLVKRRNGDASQDYSSSTLTCALNPGTTNVNGGTQLSDATIPSGLPEAALVSGALNADQNVWSALGMDLGTGQKVPVEESKAAPKWAAQYWTPGADLFQCAQFTEIYRVLSTKNFTLYPRRSKNLKFVVPKQDLSLEKYYNTTVANTNRYLSEDKSEIFVMLRIWGDLGFKSAASPTDASVPVVGRQQASLAYEVNHFIKHNVSNAPQGQYYPFRYGYFLNGSGTTITSSPYPASAGTLYRHPYGGQTGGNQVGDMLPRMANVYSGNATTSLYPPSAGPGIAQQN